MEMSYKDALDKVKELYQSNQIDEATYRDMLADLYMWEEDCEYELLVEENGKWILKIIPLMSMSY